MGNSTSFDMSNLQKCYPNFGLSHSLVELEVMDKYIHYLPIHLQEQYADTIVRENCSDEKWLKEQFQEINPEQFQKLNATAVGNMAYFALHAPTSELIQFNLDYLEKYCNWRKKLDLSSNNNNEPYVKTQPEEK